MTSVALRFQAGGAGTGSLLEHLLESCQDAERGGGIFAWANVSGAKSLLADATFEAFLKKGAFELVVGLDSITDEAAVKYLIAAEKRHTTLTVRAFLNESRDMFHPKLAWFMRDEGLTIIVGSGNLTMGGLKNNWEAYTSAHMVGSSAKEAAQTLNSYLESLKSGLVAIDDPRVLKRAQQNTGNERSLKRVPKSAAPKDTAAEPGLDVLVAEIPRSGDRGSQANFDKDNYEHFFGTPVGVQRRITLYQVHGDGTLQELESRPSVARRSRNYSFELRALKSITYPASGPPVGVFMSIEADTFLYMLLMPGSLDYNRVSKFLDEMWTGRADRMRRVRTSVAELDEYWPGAALWQAPLPAL